jgi:hypothetical protein
MDPKSKTISDDISSNVVSPKIILKKSQINPSTPYRGQFV